MRAGPVSLAVLMVAGVLAGCISDETGQVAPVDDHLRDPRVSWTIPETITGMEHAQQMAFVMDDGTELDMSVTGIWFHDDILYTSGTGLALVDVSDPANPLTLSVVDETGSRDVDIMEHPNGNLYAVLAGTPGVILVNVTDPYAPEIAATVEIGYHNLAVVPGTALVYNSRSVYAAPDLATDGGLVDIIDFTDVDNPVVTPWRMGHHAMTVDGAVKPVTAPACHDISVYPEVHRAYCAGVTETQVWDISDPLDPVILQVVHNPGTNIHHAAYANADHTILILGDELGGAAFAPGCTVSNQPYGGAWFIDISDLAKPVPVGWWGPDEPLEQPVNEPGVNPTVPPAVRAPLPKTCTTHFGNIVEDRDLLVMGYYNAGVFLIDFSDPANPVELGNFRGGGSVWEGQYYRGNVYTGDGSRGVDILDLVGDGEETFQEKA